VLDQVIAELKLGVDHKRLARQVEVRLIPNTQIIELTVRDEDPRRAAAIANAITHAFIAQNTALQQGRFSLSKESLAGELERVRAALAEIEARISALGSPTTATAQAELGRQQQLLAQYQGSYTTLLQSFEQLRLTEAQAVNSITIFEPAVSDPEPVSPSLLFNLILSVFVGVMGVLGLAFLRSALDDSLKSGAAAEDALAAPLLAVVPPSGRLGHEPPLPDPAAHTPVYDAYRQAQTNFELGAARQWPHSLAVVGVGQHDETGITATNLAITFAESGRRVVLVDANMRRPTVHGFFGSSNKRGLHGAILQQQKGSLSALLTATHVKNLQLLPGEQFEQPVTAAWKTDQIAAVIDALKQQADLVVVVCPPLLSAPEAPTLLRACDTTIAVAVLGVVTAEMLAAARRQLVYAQVPLAGLIARAPQTGLGRRLPAAMSRLSPPWRGRHVTKLWSVGE
jgi:Mrp family chromosome partitioning ATPase